jgi:hypothetical protein
MPRFSYNKQKENVTLKSSSYSGEANANVVMNESSSEAGKVDSVIIGDPSHNSQTPNVIKSQADKRLESALGIEEDYFTSDFSFDYDTNSDPFNCATAVIWSGSKEEPGRRTVSPKSMPSNTPTLSYTHPKTIPSTPTAASSSRYLTSNKKRNRVSFDNDVNFRQKSSRRLKKKKKDDKTDRTESNNSAVTMAVTPNLKEEEAGREGINSPSKSTTGTAATVSAHNTSSNKNYTCTTSKPIMPFREMPGRNDSITYTFTNDSPKLCISPRALAIDTRVLQSFYGDAIGKTFRDFIVSFLHSCSEQGLLPKVLSTTIEKEAKNKYRANIANTMVGTRTTRLCHDVEKKEIYKIDSESGKKSSMNLASDWNELLPTVYIRAPSNMNNTKNRNSVRAPKRLLAADSWRILGDLVEVTVNQSEIIVNENPRNSSIGADSMDVTIITNDVALFTDKNVDSHKRAAIRFLDRMKQKVEDKRIRSIQIIVLQTGIDALDPNREQLSTNGNIDDATSIGNFDQEYDPNLSIKEPNQNNRFQVACIAKVLKAHISSLLSKDLNRTKDGTPIDIHFDLKDLHRLHLNSILREWTKGIISSSSLTGRVSFDLPESLDGTQCSIALEVWYSIFPYSANSPHMEGLIENIRLLNHSIFEIVQLVPLEKVDLSLIYGVPLAAKAALDGDLDQYHEMQKIFSSLLKYLASNDVALALCCISQKEHDMMATIAGNSGDTKQIFLLMPQISEESSMAVLNKGMMYQYVGKGHQIIDECKGVEELESSEAAEDEYAEVIQNSLDLLEKDIFNPCKFGNARSSDDKMQGL